MHHHIPQRLALCLALFTVALPAPAASCKTRHTCSAKIQRIPSDRGSAESPQQRDQRLKRECKGRPNAGACLGYAS